MRKKAKTDASESNTPLFFPIDETDFDTGLREVSGQRGDINPVIKKKVNSFEHDLKIQINAMCKEAKRNGVPIFIAYYSPSDGYVYNGVIPEEIEDAEDIKSEYGKFYEFLRICMNYNREEFLGSEIIQTY